MRVETNIKEWKENAKKSSNKLIERLMLNLLPIAIIDNTIYLKYIGDENKKEVFFEYYNNAKPQLISYLNELYSITNISGAKELDLKKINWLEELTKKFAPAKIEFSIIK